MAGRQRTSPSSSGDEQLEHTPYDMSRLFFGISQEDQDYVPHSNSPESSQLMLIETSDTEE
jgi:hypothetical protein